MGAEGQVAGGATAETSEQGTEYVVLAAGVEMTDDGNGTTRSTKQVWRMLGKSSARSADAAIREAVGSLPEQDRKGTFVAVPARSFKPVNVSERVERTLVIS